MNIAKTIVLVAGGLILSSVLSRATSDELSFDDFFAKPIGPRGLVITDKVRSLDGKQVRITGYIVRQESTSSNVFLLTAVPVELHDEHYGLADDLPAATVFVNGKLAKTGNLLKRPGKVEVRGVLSVGGSEEADGRISLIRLKLQKIWAVKNQGAPSH